MRGKTLASVAELLGGQTEKNKMVYVTIGALPDCLDSSIRCTSQAPAAGPRALESINIHVRWTPTHSRSAARKLEHTDSKKRGGWGKGERKQVAFVHLPSENDIPAGASRREQHQQVVKVVSQSVAARRSARERNMAALGEWEEESKKRATKSEFWKVLPASAPQSGAVLTKSTCDGV